MKIKNKNREHSEQSQLVEWAHLQRGKFPGLGMLYAIPNGGHRHIGAAMKLKKEGVKRGVPDLCLPVPMGKYHGMYIEFKPEHVPGETNKTYPSLSQKQWLRALDKLGYKAVLVYGFEEGKAAILDYLTL